MTEEGIDAKIIDLARQLKEAIPEGYGGSVVVVSPDERVYYASNMRREYVGALLAAEDVEVIEKREIGSAS